MFKVYIDGQHGTAGLKLHELLKSHVSIELIQIEFSKRKDPMARKECMETADLVVFCLPDLAVHQALSLVPEGKKVLDCGSTFRNNKGWIYGLPEMGNDHRLKIASSERVANPGCFATAFVLLLRQLVQAGSELQSPLAAFATNGYSAGGHRMIKLYESGRAKGAFHALNLDHKHRMEMFNYTGISPVFVPTVGNHREGLIMSVPIKASRQKLLNIYHSVYDSESLIDVHNERPDRLSVVYEKPNVEIYVTGEFPLLLNARLSNLMKGAAGTAVQNINLMLGIDECTGLL